MRLMSSSHPPNINATPTATDYEWYSCLKRYDALFK